MPDHRSDRCILELCHLANAFSFKFSFVLNDLSFGFNAFSFNLKDFSAVSDVEGVDVADVGAAADDEVGDSSNDADGGHLFADIAALVDGAAFAVDAEDAEMQTPHLQLVLMMQMPHLPLGPSLRVDSVQTVQCA